MLKCRKGDSAFVIKSYTGRHGWVVEVLEYLGEIDVEGVVLKNAWGTYNPRDEIGIEYVSDDSWLLPIRPEELKEEEEKEVTA